MSINSRPVAKAGSGHSPVAQRRKAACVMFSGSEVANAKYCAVRPSGSSVWRRIRFSGKQLSSISFYFHPVTTAIPQLPPCQIVIQCLDREMYPGRQSFNNCTQLRSVRLTGRQEPEPAHLRLRDGAGRLALG